MPDATGPVVLRADHPEALATAAAALQAGGIVGVPTETVYGLAVLPRPDALDALVLAKDRSKDKGIALLVDSLDQVASLVVITPPARRLAAALWPGPLTLVLPLRDAVELPTTLTGGRDTLAIRLPDHDVPRALARDLGPIAASSANRSGQPPAITARELIEHVGASLTVVLDDGPVRGGVASTVVAVVADGGSEILREGALSRRDIDAVAGSGR